MALHEVKVVVPVWNQAALAVRCLERVAAVESPPLGVLVIDNGSEAAEASILSGLSARLPEKIELVRSERNLGFAAAVNIGLERAFSAGAACAFVLNSDALVEPGAIGILYKAARSCEGAGVLGPRILEPGEKGREVSSGERVSLWTLPVPRRWLRYRGGGEGVREVAAILGCAMLITRPCYEVVGGLDESFFAYYEEIDYCLRARAAGFKIVVCPSARVAHERGRGFAAGFEPLSAYLKARNLVGLFCRHGMWYQMPAFAFEYFVLIAASAGGYAARGRHDVVGALVRGAADGLRGRSGPPPEDIEQAAHRARRPGSARS